MTTTTKPIRIQALGTAQAIEPKPATPDIDTLAKRVYAIVEYGSAGRGDPDNPLRLPPSSRSTAATSPRRSTK